MNISRQKVRANISVMGWVKLQKGFKWPFLNGWVEKMGPNWYRVTK